MPSLIRESARLGELLSSKRSRDYSRGCTQLAILDLKQIDSAAAVEELLGFAKESGIDTELELVGIECDVASEESVMNAFERIRSRFGRVDAVVASAGMLNLYLYRPTSSLFKGIVENYSALEYAQSTSFPIYGDFTVYCP